MVRPAGKAPVETSEAGLAGDKVLSRKRGPRCREARRLVVESVRRSVRRPEAAALGGFQRPAGRMHELAGLVVARLVLRHVLVVVGVPGAEDQRLQRGQALLGGAAKQRRARPPHHMAAHDFKLLRQQPVSQLSVQGLGQPRRQREDEGRPVDVLQVPLLYRQRDRGRPQSSRSRAQEEHSRDA